MAEILIVDDDHHLRQGFQRLLDAEGYETRTAASAEEALNLMREKMPQCVVMDVRMPGMDGLEALKAIRSKDSSANVVMCSAMGQEGMVMDAVRSGAKDFIVKPFKPDRVLKTVNNILGTP